MSRRASRGKPQKLADILSVFLRKQKIPVHFEDQVLRRLWNQAVGPHIAAQTAPLHIKKKTLHVKVGTSVWMHQLQFMKGEIISKFNELSGNEPIDALFFSLGELPAPPREKEPSSGSLALLPLKPRDQRIIRESLSEVNDPELKGILERVMTKEIGRRRLLEKKRGR